MELGGLLYTSFVAVTCTNRLVDHMLLSVLKQKKRIIIRIQTGVVHLVNGIFVYANCELAMNGKVHLSVHLTNDVSRGQSAIGILSRHGGTRQFRRRIRPS